MTTSSSEAGSYEFDYEEWLASVEDHTVYVTAPDENVLGPRVSKLVTSKVPDAENDSYCEDCDDYIRPVIHDNRPCCPLCGSELGMLELGTSRVDPWDRDK